MASRTAPLFQDHDQHVNGHVSDLDSIDGLPMHNCAPIKTKVPEPLPDPLDQSDSSEYSHSETPKSWGRFSFSPSYTAMFTSDCNCGEPPDFSISLDRHDLLLKYGFDYPSEYSETPKSSKVDPDCSSLLSSLYSDSSDYSDTPKSGNWSPPTDLKNDKAFWDSLKLEKPSFWIDPYGLPNTQHLETLEAWRCSQPIKRKEANLFSDLPSLFALSDSQEHPGSPKSSSYSPPTIMSEIEPHCIDEEVPNLLPGLFAELDTSEHSKIIKLLPSN
ncbi:uncharacterized protein LOC107487613 isoform X2 [Arachis duranensis]|uniref:Uncharacterized protein LOC107487613 isoform X2 n=1 Tax=Arachis duranensis TaxID=130453 RepID=A0A6P4DF23_ARADU|nr:uncharacterized protein LOC107487613 isoform X2 [Arachis duranensis]XP_025698530.1 uncharacterized protein LOC112800460 isoform X2 [Arachis hypogaea]QHO40572.1 uncharacterized protein DS421_5g138400 [Arachis hypogaea]QHO40573.1 uncharacterized protein DS421_5g138400 [Arachis hypogaea]